MSRLTEEDLEVLLRSPALSLEPGRGLAEAARRQAGRVNRRRRVGAVLAAVGVAAGAITLGPAAVDAYDGLRNREVQEAGPPRDPRFPAATSAVVTMRTLNGAEVVTWYERSSWCTAASRVSRSRTCVGPVDEESRGIPRFLTAGSPSLTVDNRLVVAGVLGTDVVRVKVHLVDGREFDAEVVEGAGFVRPVWSALLAGHSVPVEWVAGFDTMGREVARVTP